MTVKMVIENNRTTFYGRDSARLEFSNQYADLVIGWIEFLLRQESFFRVKNHNPDKYHRCTIDTNPIHQPSHDFLPVRAMENIIGNYWWLYELEEVKDLIYNNVPTVTKLKSITKDNAHDILIKCDLETLKRMVSEVVV